MAIAPVAESKRTYTTFNPTNNAPSKDDAVTRLVFEAFQYNEHGHDRLRDQAFLKA